MTRVIGSTDVYSRKHIDRNHDRLDRRIDHHGDKLSKLKTLVADLQRLIIELFDSGDEEE